MNICEQTTPCFYRIGKVELTDLLCNYVTLLCSHLNIYKAVDIIILQLIGLNFLFSHPISELAGLLDPILQQ